MLKISQLIHTCFSTLMAASIGLINIPSVLACTRAVYLGLENLVITGRSMDWFSDMSTNLWAFPRGIQRNGAAGPSCSQDGTESLSLRHEESNSVYLSAVLQTLNNS